MSNVDEKLQVVKEIHESVCAQLNVDPEAVEQSWESYQSLCQNYTLDGEPLHWICCALYVACRRSVTPTVGTLGSAVEGNCVSLTKLLRLCNISLIQFFNKIKRWIEMASMPDDFKNRLEKLQKNFAVSTVLFKKFHVIFSTLFVAADESPAPRPVNGRGSKKNKLLPCTRNSVLEFCWCLFICIKGEFPHLSHDLVNMHLVLLSCIDLVFGNAIMALRRDLINPSFEGLPPDWSCDYFSPPEEPPCIISHVCDKDLVLEAKSLKEYIWKPVISKFFEQRILKGDNRKFMGLLDVLNYDNNFRSLNNLYETYVLSVGEFDERIFLGDHANDIGNPGKPSEDELSKAIANGGRSLAPDTPLTGRRYLKSKGDEILTPVSAATQCVAKLHAFLGGWKADPSPALLEWIKKCGSCEITLVQWASNWAQSLEEDLTAVGYVAAPSRTELVQRLYYYMLLAVLRRETQRKPNFSLRSLLGSEIFQHTLFACSAEVVLHAYGSQSACFPWILTTLNLAPFHFYKIIEIVVYEIKEKLSRDTVKHLNTIEEKVLESLVWTSDSPIWEQIEQLGSQIPKESEVCSVSQEAVLPAPPTPPQPPAPQRRHNGASGVPQSPVSSATDRFLLPVSDMARKQLFRDSSIKPGQSLLAQNVIATTLYRLSDASYKSSIQNSRDGVIVQGSSTQAQGSNKENTPKKSVKGGSLGLFFRKFYRLAVARMQDLCFRLGLDDTDLKRKIWTCLEHSIIHKTQLLRDRHLDQVLMCAVYVICKVSSKERTFTDIMKCYRQQPQADNNVYRQVLIKAINDDEPASTEVRGDLIKFYNTVYVPCMQGFALRFTGRQAEECPLSPLPSPRSVAASLSTSDPLSPGGQRVSQHHQLYVRPLNRSLPGSTPQTPPSASVNHLTYCFSRSPAKDLQAINSMLSCELSATGMKRASVVGRNVGHGHGLQPDSEAVKRLCVAPGVKRKMHGLITDRQAV